VERYPRPTCLVPLPLPDTGSESADIILTTTGYAGDQARTTVLYLEGDTRRVRWESPQLSEATYLLQLAADAQHVYLADQTRLLALRRSDGSVAWERALSDTILNVCRDCLLVAGGRVAALTQDGVLEVFDSASGAGAWRVRLTETPRQLVALGDALGVLDVSPDGRTDNVLRLFALDDGRALPPAEAFCLERAGGARRRHPWIYEPMFPAGDGQALYLMVQNDCAIKLGPRGEALWRTSLQGTPLQSRGDAELLITPAAVYVGARGTIAALDARTGAMRVVAEVEDYTLVPLAARDGVLVVEATRSRGSQRVELWGLDEASGERRWGQVLIGSDRFVSRTDSGDWSGQLIPAGYALVQPGTDGALFQIAVLDLADGSALASATISDDTSGSWSGARGRSARSG